MISPSGLSPRLFGAIPLVLANEHLERVFDLLRRPDMPIGAIADFSGFAQHQLDKVFRTRFGCSLRDWRKRNVQP